jgi:RiboL-PSP-HEPN
VPDERIVSRAQDTLLSNSNDIHRLFEIHQLLGGGGVGRRQRLEVVNKAALVLITAIWEAFCEDLATEALAHLVSNIKLPQDLPLELRKQVVKDLIKDPHELAIWQLADEGWRHFLIRRQNELQEERNRRLNTPKAAQIDDFFQRTLGVDSVSGTWSWPGMSPQQARDKLDGYVELRGEVAHRGAAARPIHKSTVKHYFNHVRRLAFHTANAVDAAVRDATGTRLSVMVIYDGPILTQDSSG